MLPLQGPSKRLNGRLELIYPSEKNIVLRFLDSVFLRHQRNISALSFLIGLLFFFTQQISNCFCFQCRELLTYPSLHPKMTQLIMLSHCLCMRARWLRVTRHRGRQSNNVAEDVNYFVMCKNWFPLSLWPCKTLSVKVLDYALVILLCIIILYSECPL